MDQFENPSSVAPFRAGYMLLVGMGTGDDGYNGLKFQYGELPGPGQTPKFSDFDFFDATKPGSKPTQVVTQNGNLKGSVPYLFALDQQTFQVVYYGRENGVAGVFGHTFVDNGTNLERIATAQLLVSPKIGGEVPQLGAATIPGFPGVIMATQNIDGNGIDLTWCSPPPNPQTQTYDLNVQLLQTVQTEFGPQSLSLSVVVNSFNGTADLPFLGVFSVLAPVTETIILFGFGIGMSSGTPNIVLNWVGASDNALQGKLFGLFRGADGVAYAQAQIEGWLNVSPLTVDPDPPNWIQFGDWTQVNNSHGVSQMAPVFYTFGALDPNPNIGDTQTVAMYRSFAWDSSHFQTDQVGQVKRTVFSETTDPETAQGIVLGIIDSGPPTPNENVANLAPDTLVGTTTFGVTQVDATGWTMSSSLGGTFEYKSNNGIPGIFSVNSQMQIALGVTGGGSMQIQSTDVQSFYSQSSTVAGDEGTTVINSQGVALIYFPTYTCYQFDFLDSSGNPVAGSPPYFELYPTGWVQRSPAFDYNPEATSGIIPGELMSYVVDSSSLSTLETELLNSSSQIELAWGTEGGDLPQSSQLTSGTKSVGTYLNFQESISATFGDGLDSVTVGAGVQASFNFNYTWSSSVNDQIQTQIGLLAASAQNPNAYTNYTYDVLLLEHDQAHTQELISLLESYQTPNNQALLEIIAPNSVPWKMMHVLRSWQQEGQTQSQASGAMADFLARHPGWKPRGLGTRKLKAAGTSG
jgi:hypothetical protein